MKISMIALLFFPLSMLAHAEKMPWETDAYKESEAERIGEILSSVPLESLVVVGVISKKGEEGISALVQIPGGQTYVASKGVRIGLNQGVISSVEGSSIQIVENIPVCGTADFIRRTLSIFVPGSAPAGTTVRYRSENGANVCS